MKIQRKIKKFMRNVSDAAGTPAAFVTSFSLVILWVFTGPFFNYSEDWQLFINTITTILTFLMVFCIQYSQNRDTKELQMKLNAIVREYREQFEEIEKLLEEEDD